MAFDNPAKPERDIVAERMALLSKRANEKPFVVPAHLKGTLFSPRDCFSETLAEHHKGLDRFPGFRKGNG